MPLNIYVADMELQGVLLFSSEQRPALASPGGAVITTSPFIHNYPLIYGFYNKPVEAYTVIPSLHFLSYKSLKESRFVPKKLAKMPLKYMFVEQKIKRFLEGGRALYVFPAYPLKITRKKFFMAAKGYGYVEFRGRLKTVYPRLEQYVAIVPPSRFRTVVLSNFELPSTIYIRIGMKRMGLFKVQLKKANILRRVEEYAWTSVPVNLHDVGLFGYTVFNVLKLLEKYSKPQDKPLSAVIGYIRARNLFEVSVHHSTVLRIPLPLKLIDRKGAY